MSTLFTALRALAFMSGFVLLWGWAAWSVRPFDSRLGVALPAGTRTPGILLMAIGAALGLWCAGAFVVQGRGTPAPFDAPRKFVAAGPYQCVRNPMYIGGLAVLIGFGLLQRSPSIVIFALPWLLAAHLFVIGYEEPTLKRKFGATYEQYCRRTPRWLPKLGSLFLLSLVAFAQGPPAWKDPSNHEVHFVTVEEGVRLEVLDWGGAGRPLVLLTGSGNTAHVYDNFGPKLSDCCRVYAITRRGFGLSSHPDAGYDDQRLADDVLQVLNALQIQAPVLVGHSLAGSELTTLGAQHSDRLSGLVYLDAGADPADFPWSDPAYRAVVKRLSPAKPAPPSPLEVNRKRSYEAYRAWQMETGGFAFCEAEVRNMYDFNPDGSIGAYRTPNQVRDAIDKGTKKRDYSSIRVPVLSIFATPPSPADDLKKHPRDNPDERAAVEQHYTMLMQFIHRYEKSLQSAVPDARVLEWPGANHYLFLARETDVLRELHAFLEAAAASAAKSPFAGTWEGAINGLPGAEVTIKDAGGKLSGVMVFYFQQRGPDGKWRVEGKSTLSMLEPKVNGKVLSFEAIHYKVHGGTERGPNVAFRLELSGANEALLRHANPHPGDAPPLKLTRRSN